MYIYIYIYTCIYFYLYYYYEAGLMLTSTPMKVLFRKIMPKLRYWKRWLVPRR